MEADVQRRLLELNRLFYDRFARSFADSRSTRQASVRRILSLVPDGAAVLDVGCGDGRAARALDEMGIHADYLGLDASEPLIALARRRSESLSHVQAAFLTTDITDSDQIAAVSARRFDIVLALAVLHHIPGDGLRGALVHWLSSLLAPGGVLIVSTWQFLSSERLRRKIVSWATIGLDDAQVDAGDYVLDWQRGGHGLRYVHHMDEGELRRLLAAAHITVVDSFVADRGLNLYMIGKALANAPTGVL